MNSFKKIAKKESDYISGITRYCKCGHSVQFRTMCPYITCNYCGRLIFRDRKCEYNFKIKRRFANDS